MFARDDMVGLMAKTAVLLVKAAVFASPAGTETYSVAQSGRQWVAHDFFARLA
jgi:hypothetical protein